MSFLPEPMRAAASPIGWLLALMIPVAWHRSSGVDHAARSPKAALVSAFHTAGLISNEGDVLWLARPKGFVGVLSGQGAAIVRARVDGEPHDLYLVDVRFSPEGQLLSLVDMWNLTGSASADESLPIVSPSRPDVLAYTTSIDDTATAIHLLHFRGESTAADLSTLERMQTRVTNLQKVGRASGIGHDAYTLLGDVPRVELAFDGAGTLRATLGDRTLAISEAGGPILEGGELAEYVPEANVRPPKLVQWAVDRVRAVPWLGDEKTMWVKAIAFTGLNWVQSALAKEATAKDVADEIGGLGEGGSGPVMTQVTDPDIGWPPTPLSPNSKTPLPGEGQWIDLSSDPFVSQSPGLPAAFVTTFVRPSPKRPDLRVYITLWDPRQVALHMESGAVEPVSATGVHGAGLIPRSPEILRHVVAAFNGGFQAQHGEYGMMANGVVYLPPKPYAATVAELRDGSTAFGVWPPFEKGTSPTIPPDVLSFRQNLTPIVQGDKWNPWGRTWWGGTPPGWGDNIHTARSALCLTKEKFVGYVWSASISPDDMAAAMLLARCDFGMHLDMNPGHAGFEFYNIQPVKNMSPLGRPLQTDWEAEGKLKDLPDWQFRARRMIRGMGHMNFPRYIQREGRDFFYLTKRTVLPGPPLSPGEGAKPSPWRVKGIPQQGFPYAIATSDIRPDSGMPLRVLRLDPRALKPVDSPNEPTVVSFAGVKARGAVMLFHTPGSFTIAEGAPTSLSRPIVSGARSVERARAGVGIHDEDGMATWVEVSGDGSISGEVLDDLLKRWGCSARMLIVDDDKKGARAVLGSGTDLGGIPMNQGSSRLGRAKTPTAAAIFPEVEVVPYAVWQPLQAQRVKYAVASEPSQKAGATQKK